MDQDKLLAEFDRITSDESHFLKAKSPAVLRSKITALENLRNRIYSNTRHYITGIFLGLCSYPMELFTKPAIAKTLIKEGEQAMEKGNIEQLRTAAIHLSHLTHTPPDWETAKIKGTGIG
jgi:hypothetical protein